MRIINLVPILGILGLLGCAEEIYTGYNDDPYTYNSWEDKAIIGVGSHKADDSNYWEEVKLLARQACAKWDRTLGPMSAKKRRATNYSRYYDVLLYEFPCHEKN